MLEVAFTRSAFLAETSTVAAFEWYAKYVTELNYVLSIVNIFVS
jgi:hypothetical protein